MRSSCNPGRQEGSIDSEQTEKRAGHLCPGPYRLDIIGLGSSGLKGITLLAQKALSEAEIVIGYKLYLEQAKPWLNNSVIIKASGMTAETKRAEEALELALEGKKVAVVSGGDPGVYAMAGAIFEVAATKKINLGNSQGQLNIKVLTGTPALTAGAAILGAPLTHDFCAISLSDRLTDWELIKKRLEMASLADFVIILYNPKSKGRDWQLAEAAEIMLKHKSPNTPVGLASRLGREGEKTEITTLANLSTSEVDMQTIVFIGNEQTFVYNNFMITPRGYVKKYGPKINPKE
jgi:precorrin-3B C17-methyltransferase